MLHCPCATYASLVTKPTVGSLVAAAYNFRHKNLFPCGIAVLKPSCAIDDMICSFVANILLVSVPFANSSGCTCTIYASFPVRNLCFVPREQPMLHSPCATYASLVHALSAVDLPSQHSLLPCKPSCHILLFFRLPIFLGVKVVQSLTKFTSCWDRTVFQYFDLKTAPRVFAIRLVPHSLRNSTALYICKDIDALLHVISLVDWPKHVKFFFFYTCRG